MLQKSARIFLTSVMLIAGASISFAQILQFKVGDEVEAYTYQSFAPSTHWAKAKIVAVETNGQHKGPYQVQFDGQDSSWNEWPLIDSVRSRAGSLIAANPLPNGNGPKTNVGGAWGVGNLVDVFYDAKRGKDRGTIIEVGDGRYKVHYTGCKAYWDEWVDRMLIHPAATISNEAPAIAFLKGKWSMTTVGISRVAIAWGKSNDIQINGDGTYVWFQSGGKPSVKGKWVTDAKVEGTDTGTAKFDGILIKDAQGQEWKLYRRIVESDSQDKVTIHQMCEGITDIGTRVR